MGAKRGTQDKETIICQEALKYNQIVAMVAGQDTHCPEMEEPSRKGDLEQVWPQEELLLDEHRTWLWWGDVDSENCGSYDTWFG